MGPSRSGRLIRCELIHSVFGSGFVRPGLEVVRIPSRTGRPPWPIMCPGTCRSRFRCDWQMARTAVPKSARRVGTTLGQRHKCCCGPVLQKTGSGRVPSFLNELNEGQQGRIIRVGGRGAIKQRLLDMGVTRGTTVLLKRRAPLGDPLQITVKGCDLAIRVKEARYIQVEILDEAEHSTAADTDINGTRKPSPPE